MDIFSLFVFIAGLVFLIKGADIVTNHSSIIARKYGVSGLVIGITLVAFSTSLPELAVSLVSAIMGTVSIATGTIIGSNIANIGLIMGISALIISLREEKQYFYEAPFMLLSTILISILLIIGLVWWGGAIIIITTFLYMRRVVKKRKMEFGEKIKRFTKRKRMGISTTKHLGITFLGAGIIILGANMLVFSTVNIAQSLGVSELVISMIMVAIGTSLPELATSFVAAVKKMGGISIGNIIGSNIFNITILGLTSLVVPIPVNWHIVFVDIPIMILITVVFLLFIRTGWKITRPEGLTLLAFYAFFLISQFVF
jgi:cation:H+ antiporter